MNTFDLRTRLSRLLPTTFGILLAAGAAAGPPAPADAGTVLEAFLRITALEDQRISGPEILPFLTDPDPVVRGRAALAIGRIGRAEDVSALSGLLQDRDPAVRRWAAFGLGEIEDSTAAAPLARILEEGAEADAQVRALAVEGLGKLRAWPGACRKALADPAIEVQVAALLAAWKIPVSGALDDIARSSMSPDPDVRFAASYCLMRLVGAPAAGRTAIPAAPSLSEPERSRAVERMRALMADREPRVRLQAIRGLASFGDSATTRLLLGTAADPDWRAQVEGIRALASQARTHPARIVGLREVDPFLAALNPNVRISAVEGLADLGAAGEVLPRLRDLLADPCVRIREVSFGSLLARYRAEGSPLPAPAAEAVRELSLQMLREKDWTLRELVADGASLLPPDAAGPILEELLGQEPRVAKSAVEPLLRLRATGGTGDLLPRLRPTLDPLLAASDPILRALAIETVRGLLTDSSLAAAESDWAALEGLLAQARQLSLDRDSGSDVRLAVVEAASARGSRPGMRRILDECANDPAYLVRKAAAAALRELGAVPPRAPEPVETGRQLEDYRSILEWAEKDHWALIETEGGTIRALLYSREAPLTCWNFARLAGSGFYDRGRWHRVVPDFVLQDGCPRGDGYGGSDREIRCEINHESFSTGALGMALSGKDTGSSQFFFTHSDQPHLDGRYTVFGRIISGQQVADQIVQGSPIYAVRVVDQRP